MTSRLPLVIAALTTWSIALAARADDSRQQGVVLSEFIYETAPFPQCHASTIAEGKQGLVAAWFGGTREKDPDVGVWLSRQVDRKWTAPIEVASGVQSDGTRHPCWNPVLFQPSSGPLLLFYKVGPDPQKWWGMLTRSDDGGRSWSQPERLPSPIIGPVKNKPIELAGGVILCPSSSEFDGWRVHFDRTTNLGRTWEQIGPIHDGKELGLIQPSILQHGGGNLQILCRSKGAGKIGESWSSDNGRTWSKPTLTELPNPNSGTDAVTMADGRHVLIYNHTSKGRSPLNVAVSSDGKHWQGALLLENQPGEYS